MSEITLSKESAPQSSGIVATLKHARYVIGENPVTGFAFGLFVLIVFAAVLGPYIVPYDPLASNTAMSLILQASRVDR